MRVCLDTSLLILSAQASPTLGNEELFASAKAYEIWLAESECEVLIPTPVISEFLSSTDAAIRRNTLKHLQKFANIADFDLRAAELAANLRLRYAAMHGLPKGLKRQVLTVDMMIAAVAIVNRSSHLITHDVGDFRRIISGFEGSNICIRDVAQGPPGQGDLFGS